MKASLGFHPSRLQRLGKGITAILYQIAQLLNDNFCLIWWLFFRLAVTTSISTTRREGVSEGGGGMDAHTLACERIWYLAASPFGMGYQSRMD